MEQQYSITTPLGDMIAAIGNSAVNGLWFSGEKHAPAAGKILAGKGDQLVEMLQCQLSDYFAGKRRLFDLPIAPAGTAFQMGVWRLLREIPFGMTSTYGALARQLAEARDGAIPAAQAVGGAVGRNPISIIIPCHRVVGANGSLTGYAGGLHRKSALLALERYGKLP